MAEMTAKEFLRQARTINQDIERKHDEILELQARATRATSASEALRVSGTPQHSKLEDAAIELAELGGALGRDIARFAKKYNEISAVINAVENPTYRRLLTLRYLECKRWEDIAVRMNYSWAHMHRLHGEALREVEKTR